MILVLGPGRFEPDDDDPIVGPEVDVPGCHGMLNALGMTLAMIVVVAIVLWLI